MEKQTVIGSGNTGGPGQFSTPATQPTSQEEIAGSPLWHLFDFNLIDQTFTLIKIAEAIYRETSFLDSRISTTPPPMVRYEMQHLNLMFPRPDDTGSPLRWIFHIGHCGSTLLSRALAATTTVLPMREPMSLRTLSAEFQELNTPFSLMPHAQWNALLSTITNSLSRRFHPEQVNIIKATSTCNNLIQPVLEDDDGRKAVLLYLPLENYLATMLNKPRQSSDLWGQSRSRMKDWSAIDGARGFELHELQAPQLAVISWLTSIDHMLNARELFGERVLMLNFESLLADPTTSLSQVTSFMGIEGEAETIIQQFPTIASGYSKQPNQKYTPQIREQLLQRTRAEHAAGIKTGLDWARSQIAATPALASCAEFLK